MAEFLDIVYGFLLSIGFHHPLHPASTHVPLGLALSAVAFGIYGTVFKKDEVIRTAKHCIMLALVAVPAVIMLGIMDWMYVYKGAWRYEIKIKFVLAGLLTLIFFIIVFFTQKKGKDEPKKSWGLGLLGIHGLAALCAIGLGFFGAEIMNVSIKPKAVATKELNEVQKKGLVVFNNLCSSCHSVTGEVGQGPSLNGLFKKDKIRNGKPLNDENLIAFIKNPEPTEMPGFPDESEEDYKAVIEYLKTVE